MDAFLPSSLRVPMALVLLVAGPGASAEPATSPGAATRAADATAAGAAAPAGFAPGEEIDLTLDYLHVRAGQVRLLVGKPEGSVWPVICQARTDGAATLLDIREHFVSYWDAEARASRGSDLNAIEIGDRHTDRTRFDRVQGKARVEVIRKEKVRESTHDVPRDVQDLASALLFLRLQPLAPGMRFEYPVFHGTSSFALLAEVQGTERVNTPAGQFDALRIKVRLGLGDKFKTKRDSYVWLSNDERHIPVRMSAEFAVGSMTATLSSYRPGGQFAAAR